MDDYDQLVTFTREERHLTDELLAAVRELCPAHKDQLLWWLAADPMDADPADNFSRLFDRARLVRLLCRERVEH